MAKNTTKNKKLKKITALGVAAFGLAALPVAGVFAAELGDGIMTHKDALQININPVCTFGTINSSTGLAVVSTDADFSNATDQTSHTDNNGTWANGTQDSLAADGTRTDTLSATMQPGTTAELGSTTFTVRCNNTSGWNVTAAWDGVLTNANGTASRNTIPFNQSGNVASASYWKMSVAKVDDSVTTIVAAPADETGTIIAGTALPGNVKDGEKFTVTYDAGIHINQEAGTYTGGVTYTLAQLDSGSSAKSGEKTAEGEKTKGGDTKSGTETEGGSETKGGDAKSSGTDQSQGEGGTEGSDEVNSGNEDKITGGTFNNSFNNTTTNNTTNNNTNNTYNTTENYYEQGGTATPTLAQVQEKPDEEEEAEKDSAKDGFENPLGAMSSTGGTVASVTAKKDEDGGNFVLPVVLAVAGTAAALSAGVYAYKKSQEEE